MSPSDIVVSFANMTMPSALGRGTAMGYEHAIGEVCYAFSILLAPVFIEAYFYQKLARLKHPLTTSMVANVVTFIAGSFVWSNEFYVLLLLISASYCLELLVAWALNKKHDIMFADLALPCFVGNVTTALIIVLFHFKFVLDAIHR